MSSLWDQITVLHKKISKQDVIDTIKNGESSLLSLDINSDLKNEIREKVTNNIMHNFNKDRGMSAGSDPFLTVDHNFRWKKNLGNYSTSLERSDDYKTFWCMVSWFEKK